jgi:hypothetical protein
MIYLIKHKPFTNNKLNKLEIMNEFFVILVSYHLILFNDYLPNPELRYSIGWSTITLTSLALLINMIVILIDFI